MRLCRKKKAAENLARDRHGWNRRHEERVAQNERELPTLASFPRGWWSTFSSVAGRQRRSLDTRLSTPRRDTTPERIRSVVFDLIFKLCIASGGEIFPCQIGRSTWVLNVDWCFAGIVLVVFGGSGQ